MDALLQASPEAAGWAAVAAVYAATYVAASLVPVAATPGYVIDPATGKPQLYRLNGLRCLVLLVAAAAAAVAAGGVPGGLLYELYWPCTRAACAYGLALSAAMYVRGTRLLATRGGIDRRARCPTADAPAGGPRRDTADFDARSAAAHFYCGLSEFNPAGPGGVDLKMWLYLAGAVQLQLNVLSAVYAAVAATSGGAGFSVASLRALPPPLLAYAGCLTFFVVEYLYHEDVHTYTYDIFRERVGFKLVWGCLCFYPQFYCVGVFFVTGAAAATPVSPAAAWGCVALFFGGWVLTRGANLQKFACKTGGGGASRGGLFGGLVPMGTLPGSGGRILVSGFWGVARHVNYSGEVLQAAALALPGVLASGSLVPLLYPAYYVALFIPRCLDDDAQCEAKYGAKLWGAYRARVPWRMVPGLW